MTQPQSQCIWQDLDTGYYYLLNNETGKKKRVNKTGEYIKKFNVELTGKVNFQERVQKAQGDPGFLPFEVHSKHFDPQKQYYTPQNDKFEGYSQFPCPRTQPYYNQQRELKLDLKKRMQIKKCESELKLRDDKNKTLFTYGGSKKYNLGVSFITGTRTDYQKSLKQKEIPVLKQRSYAEEKVKVESDLNGTKIINDRVLQAPNLILLTKTLQKQETVKPEKEENNEQMKVDDVINQKRYTQKVTSINEKTFGFSIVPKEVQEQMNKYSVFENTRTQNIDSMFSRIDGLQTKTFEKEIKLNFTKNVQDQNLKTIQNIEQDLERKKQELEGFKLPEIKEKNTVVTKGRFGYNIPSDKSLYDEGKRIMLLNYPELFQDKTNQRKKELEQQRRQLLRQVIEDMLSHNEKLKL